MRKSRIASPKNSSRWLSGRVGDEIDLVAEMAVLNPFDFFVEPYVENWPFQYREEEGRELAPFRVLAKHGAAAKRAQTACASAGAR